MNLFHWRISLVLCVFLLTAATALTLRPAEEYFDRTPVETLRHAAPLLALAADSPQVRAAVLGDPATVTALNEIFFVESAAIFPGKGREYDLVVIATAPHYRGAAAKQQLLQTFVRQHLSRGGVMVIPRSWAAAADFPCRLTCVPGTGGNYLFLTPPGEAEPTLAVLSHRLALRRRQFCLPPYPEGILEAYFGMEEQVQPPQKKARPVPEFSFWRWGGAALLLLLTHMILAERSRIRAEQCYAAENGAAVTLFCAGLWMTLSAFQAEWGFDPVWLLPLAALFFAGFEANEKICRRAGWVTSLILAATLLLSTFGGAAPWYGIGLTAAAALWIAGAGMGIKKSAILPLLGGAALGGGAAFFLMQYNVPTQLFFVAALSLKITFLLRI